MDVHSAIFVKNEKRELSGCQMIGLISDRRGIYKNQLYAELSEMSACECVPVSHHNCL